ncbi:MAG: AAA family ATPase [Phycisphaerae bacterium]|nr:AAA family ATPase [Phycisphaerae bacterium]
MRTIAIINQKGGCGKTTTAINLSGVFARAGQRTLLVDLDPQSHCAAGLAIPEHRIDMSVGDAMVMGDLSKLDSNRLLWRVSRNLDLAPSTIRLAGMESPRGGLAVSPEPERRLCTLLAALADRYDLCVIDCSPSIGLLTFNALVAASEVIIPVETGFFALQGATKQISTIRSLTKKLGVSLPYRVLATMFDAASPLARDLLDELRRRFGPRLLPSVIRFDQSLREAVSFGQPVIEYAPDSCGAEDYLMLATHLLDGHSATAVMSGDADPDHVGEPDSQVRVVEGAADRVLEIHPPAPAPAGPMIGTIIPRPPAPETSANIGSRAAEMVALAHRLTPDRSSQAHALLGVRQTSQGTFFVQPASLGRLVCIAADFNGWSAEASPMRLNPALGVFEACLRLPAGPVQYRLVIDGVWQTDPHNPLTQINPFGESNSVFVVPDGVAWSNDAQLARGA